MKDEDLKRIQTVVQFNILFGLTLERDPESENGDYKYTPDIQKLFTIKNLYKPRFNRGGFKKEQSDGQGKLRHQLARFIIEAVGKIQKAQDHDEVVKKTPNKA